MQTIHKKEFKKRTLASLKFEITPNFKIGVSMYCMLRTTTKPTPAKLNGPDNKRLKTVTTWVCEETGK